MTLKTFFYGTIFYGFFQTLKWPKIPEDGSDFDDFWTKKNGVGATYLLKKNVALPSMDRLMDRSRSSDRSIAIDRSTDRRSIDET